MFPTVANVQLGPRDAPTHSIGPIAELEALLCRLG